VARVTLTFCVGRYHRLAPSDGTFECSPSWQVQGRRPNGGYPAFVTIRCGRLLTEGKGAGGCGEGTGPAGRQGGRVSTVSPVSRSRRPSPSGTGRVWCLSTSPGREAPATIRALSPDCLRLYSVTCSRSSDVKGLPRSSEDARARFRGRAPVMASRWRPGDSAPLKPERDGPWPSSSSLTSSASPLRRSTCAKQL
jgi:hypothetical protein